MVFGVCIAESAGQHDAAAQWESRALHTDIIGMTNCKRIIAAKNSLMGPHSSTGSPMTFMMRPSVSRPTGTCHLRRTSR